MSVKNLGPNVYSQMPLSDVSKTCLSNWSFYRHKMKNKK